MSNFGQFLYSLRKEKGMTQAELAEELGVTNKAVSKWETDEAMPETSLLLPLSRIFGVTVDELLDGKRHNKEGQKENNYEAENYNEDNKSQTQNIDENVLKNHIFVRGKEDDENETLLDRVKDAVCGLIMLLGLAAYLISGAIFGVWHPYWIILPICGMLCGLIGITFDVCNKEKIERKQARGENPYIGAICGFIMLVCIIVYFVLGAILNLWHPLWIIPAVGAFMCAVVGTIGEIFNYKRNNKNK